MTPAQFAGRIKQFEVALPGAKLKGLQRGLQWGVRAIALRMDVKDRDAVEDPPNAPPGPIAVRTGRLRRGLTVVGPSMSGSGEVTGAIAVRGVEYAAIHEYGGQTRPHIILPRKASVLAFGVGGKTVFASRVLHPGSNIPARPYLAPVVPDIRERAVQEMRREIGKTGSKLFGSQWKSIIPPVKA